MEQMTKAERMLLENQRVIMGSLRYLLNDRRIILMEDTLVARIIETDDVLGSRGPAAGSKPPVPPVPRISNQTGQVLRPADPPPGWLPIETAPKDGTPIDLWCRPTSWFGGSPRRMVNYWWVDGIGWRTERREDDLNKTKWREPTHWMPIPAGPHGHTSVVQPKDDAPATPPNGLHPRDIWPNASDEPLSVIESNECEGLEHTLCTRRFRRLFNELRARDAALALLRRKFRHLDVVEVTLGKDGITRVVQGTVMADESPTGKVEVCLRDEPGSVTVSREQVRLMVELTPHAI